ncbi:radical SAM protein [Candidatus Woesearchaeota archaeon]|nr:radical SAM protein [Candidatus Woesearchaeota archaeon]
MELKEVRHLITYDCPLRCLHCYMSAGEQQIKATQFTQEQADAFYSFFKPKVVSATGGEPLLEPALINILAKSTAKIGSALELVTNGLLLTEGFVKELNNLNKNTFYQISLDGTEAYHNKLRQSNKAYKGAIKAIDMCSASGRLTKARITITQDNYGQLPEVIKLLDEYKRDNIKLVMRPVIDSGRAKINGIKTASPTFNGLEKFEKLAQTIKVETTDNIGKCGCGIDTISIDPTGDIYPCCYSVYNPQHKMGNIFMDFQKLKENPDFSNFRGNCYARHIKK